MIRTRRQARHMAMRLLLAWVLALVAGGVNACLLEPHTAQAHDVVSHARGSYEHSSSHEANAACVKFCGDISSALKASTPDVDSTAIAMAPPASQLMPTPAGDVPHGIAPTTVAWRGAVPIPIAFLRLTL